jgi:polygalacturonase
MMKKHDNQFLATPATTKRKFLAKPLVIAVSLTLSAVAFPAAASNWWDATPHISVGSRTINVKNMGARGNGRHDDTAAIQHAINALPRSGGTVYVPAGRYMINARKSLRLHSHTRLQLAENAELRVIPNGATRYYAVKVTNASNVAIVGGKITGDRARHKGSRGEWGYGIDISGSDHVLVRNVTLSEFWGDGMWIGALGKGRRLDRSNYVTLNNVTSSHNRRQGLSIGPVHHLYIFNSTFKNTRGTKPEAGIDFEPQRQGPVDTVRVEKSTFAGNRGNGVEMHDRVSNVTFTGNLFSGNHGFGLMSINAHHMNMTGNHAARNGLAGLRMSAKTHHVSIRNNRLQYNSTRFVSPSRAGGSANRDIQISQGAYAISQSRNTLSPRRK